MELTKQLCIMLHHILMKHRFYQLPQNYILEILQLLQQSPSNQKDIIQKRIFQGIINICERYQIAYAPYLSQNIFQHISEESKMVLFKILHESYFLYQRKAYENFSQKTKTLFLDDRYQRQKLNYMYYGPDIIHQKDLISYQNNHRQFIFPPQESNKKMGLLSNQFIFSGNIHRNSDQKSIANNRGRPSKQKNKLIESKESKRINKKILQFLTDKFSDSHFLGERDEKYSECLCNGFLPEQNDFQCSCGKYFHKICMEQNNSSDHKCAMCRMRELQPYSKISEKIGEYYLYNLDLVKFQEMVNLKTYENICKTGRFEIEIRCMKIDENVVYKNQSCWPDNLIFQINHKCIFQIPALLISHNQKYRQDSPIVITSFIFKNHNQNVSLTEKTSFTLQINHSPSETGDLMRNNTKSAFVFGIYLIQKINIQDLQKQIINQNKDAPLTNLQNQQDSPIQLSVVDPYSKNFIQIPVRGDNCKHLQCFDLHTYLFLMKNVKYKTWKCPICQKTAKNLIIDKYQLKVIEEMYDLPNHPTLIVLDKNGNLDLIQKNKRQ